MFRPRVIPVLLLHDLGLVKTAKFSRPNYIGDPMNAVHIFNESQADELVFLDISATREGRIPSLDLIASIAAEAFMPFAVGGGVRSLEHIKLLIGQGAEKVVICSAAADTPHLITEGANCFGAQSIVVSIDVKKDIFGRARVYTHSGGKSTGLDPITYAKRMEDAGAGEIFVNAISLDGMMRGYDIELVRAIAEAVSVPIIACGGAGSLADLARVVNEGGASAAAAGSLFVYHGSQKGILINYPSRQSLRNLFSSPHAGPC